MNSIEIFGRQVEIREKDCSVWGNKANKFGDGHTVNLFIQLTNKCNASCKFCEYHTDNGKEFDFDKLILVLDELMAKATVGKINITGGEPTINNDNFNRLLEILRVYKGRINSSIKPYDNNNGGILGTSIHVRRQPYLTVNTNGCNIESLSGWSSLIDSYAISRHHYDDTINAEIFGTDNVASTDDIRNLVDTMPVGSKHKVHLRCNLISGYIDSIEKIHNYLEYCSKLGIIWVGFVTLMPLNKYCIENVVMADKLISSDTFFLSEPWERIEQGKVECRCSDYLYPAPDGKIIRLYNRIFCNPGLSAGQLVFDGQNLRLGFSGEIIL